MERNVLPNIKGDNLSEEFVEVYCIRTVSIVETFTGMLLPSGAGKDS